MPQIIREKDPPKGSARYKYFKWLLIGALTGAVVGVVMLIISYVLLASILSH